MTLGEVVLGLAVAAAIGAFALPARWRPRAARAHSALVLVALAWLTTDFLATTLRHSYTWAHTRVGDPFFYRLAGVWGGEEGTVLLWNAVIAAGLLAFAGRTDPLDRRARAFLLAASGALAFLGLVVGTFRATSAAQLALAPAGRGLSDILLTPLMVVHPPIQFVGYGLMAFPAAYALASLWGPAGDGAWAGRAFPWARGAWFFATLGLMLGALWAYYVLSFGGFWAWDPVETSNLLPWLALTAFLHAGKQRMRGQGNATASLVLAYGAFLLTLFATFATRSGLWVSVHAFTDPTQRFEPDAAARLLAILDAHAPTRAFLGILSASLLAGSALFAAKRVGTTTARVFAALLFAIAGAALLAPATVWGAAFWLASVATPLPVGMAILALLVAAPFIAAFARDDEQHAKPRLDARTLMAVAVVLLSVALGVAWLLNLQVVNGPDRSVFDARAPFVAVPIVSAITLMLALAPLGKRGAVILTALSLALGLLGAWRMADARMLGLAAPLCAGAAVAAILKLAQVQGASAPRPLRVAGSLLGFAGLLGFVMWSNPPTYLIGVPVPHEASLTLGFLGVGLSVLAILGALAAFRARSRSLAVAGALAAALAVGYGVGALLALAALALVLRERGAFRPGFWAHERPRVRETGIYLVHLAVVIGLLGFAAATYAQEREVFAAVPLGSTATVADYALATSPGGATVSEGKFDSVTFDVALAKDGSPVGEESLDFVWRARDGVYEGRLEVRRTLAEDVYLSPMAFHTANGWVGADSAAGSRADAASIDMITYSVSILPLMSFVWAAAWLLVVGMGFVLVATRGRQA